MISIEKQVTSLEISKELEELGVKQDSYFYWAQNVEKKKWKVFPSDYLKHFHDYEEEKYSAFTVAELGEMLPDWADFTQKHYNSTSKKTWYRCYTKVGITLIDDFKEADARAKMLIHLIENELMEAT